MSPPRLPLLALAAAAALACGAPAPPNVVVVSIDTLRADAIGAYGGPPAPTLDRLAAEGVVFERAFAPTPTTAPSHATLFTGQEVPRHGLLRNGDALPETAATLAEAFRGAGFRTAGFASSFVLDGRFGWGQGFETWDDELPEATSTMRKSPYPGAFWAAHRFTGFDRRATATTQAATAWLATAGDGPFFLFVHYFDPHAPYDPPRPYLKRTGQLQIPLEHRGVEGLGPEKLTRMVRRYYAEVAYADESLGALLEAVRARSAERGVLVVVTSDHGEGLGQHGWLEHAVHLYDEQIHVPLVLHWPGVLPAGHRVRTQVGLVDVAPTVAELTGLPAFPAADGRSLAAAARGGPEPEPRPIYGDRHLVAETVSWDHGIKTSVRTDAWKLIRSSDGRAELYDLAADPGELRDTSGRSRDVAAALGSLIDQHTAGMPGAASATPLSDETKAALRALGYAE